MIKLYKCENGHLYKFPQKSCFYCSHCTDVFWDYSNGPYMVFCELSNSCTDDANIAELCNEFEDDVDDTDNIIRVEETESYES